MTTVRQVTREVAKLQVRKAKKSAVGKRIASTPGTMPWMIKQAKAAGIPFQTPTGIGNRKKFITKTELKTRLRSAGVQVPDIVPKGPGRQVYMPMTTTEPTAGLL